MVVVLLHLAGRGGVVHAGRLVAHAALGLDGGPQVDEEGEDVEGEDEGDHPLEDGGHVVVLAEVVDGEGDGQRQFDQDKGELDPERDAQDAVLAVSYMWLVSDWLTTRGRSDWTYGYPGADTPSR